DAGSAFEPQRNVIQAAVGLDGGGSVAADDSGNVYVAWHAPQPGIAGEENRCVWIASSKDEGKSFSAEKPAFAQLTGACGCFGMRDLTDKSGRVYTLYRSAGESIHRDMYVLVSSDRAASFQGMKLDGWETRTCPMSTATLARASTQVIAAWETQGQVYFAR